MPVRGDNGELYVMRLAITRGLINAVAEGNSRTSKQLVDLARLLQRDVGRPERQVMFDNIGRRARIAIQSSYGSTVVQNQGPSGYRTQSADPRNRRFAGGMLQRALGVDSNIYEASPTGLKFVNMTGLDRAARHWYRLNAGVAPRGRGSRRTFQVNFSNVAGFSIGLEMDPSPPMRIPKGFWVEGGSVVAPGARGTSEFYPVSEAGQIGDPDGGGAFPGRRITPTGKATSSGFPGRNFLDAGAASIADDLADRNLGLQGLYREFVHQGLASVQRATKYFKVDVIVGEYYTPRPIRGPRG